jgi:radical SAM superfamily enzyme YgiQ (UPF0313 family)
MRTMWKSDPRPVEQVVEEIRSLHTKTVVFYDPNFFGKRDYAMALMKAMEPLHILWASDATADFGYDHELMELAYRSGCRGVVIGLESLNAQSLSGVNKRFFETDKYEEIIRNIHSHGIAVNGCFVLGFDSDTEEELLDIPARVERLGLDLCKFAILTPYPGTGVYRQMDREGRITSKNWDLYNQHHTPLPTSVPSGCMTSTVRCGARPIRGGGSCGACCIRRRCSIQPVSSSSVRTSASSSSASTESAGHDEDHIYPPEHVRAHRLGCDEAHPVRHHPRPDAGAP